MNANIDPSEQGLQGAHTPSSIGVPTPPWDTEAVVFGSAGRQLR